MEENKRCEKCNGSGWVTRGYQTPTGAITTETVKCDCKASG